MLASRNRIQILQLCRLIHPFKTKKSRQTYQPVICYQEAFPKETEWDYSFVYKTEISTSDLKILSPFLTPKICAEYGIYPLVSFSHVSNSKARITGATENYPIFKLQHGGWSQIYQPLHPKKQYRILCVGNKPKNYVYGLNVLTQKFKVFQKSNSIKFPKSSWQQYYVTVYVMPFIWRVWVIIHFG